MRQPDRPEPGTFTGNREDLADRLARLPDRHPSSPARSGEVSSREASPPDDPFDPSDEAGAQPEPGAEAAEEPGQDQTGTGPDRGGPGGPRPGGSHAGGGGIDGGGGNGSGPYRPWFADGGPGEPWFAADPDGGPATPGG
jgi:hypothetical protein